MKTGAYRDQVVIVTGASAGIGRAIAIQLAGQGAKLVLAARRKERLEEVAAECRALGGAALVVPTDVSREEQCQKLVEETMAAFGRLDMLVSNAGLAVLSRLEDYTTLDLFRHVMNVNFYGAVHCSYYSLPYLKQSQGRILAISSLGGKAALPYNSPYCASKSALNSFFDALRMEVTHHGVSVTLVCPFWVVTEFHEAVLDKNGVPAGAHGRAVYTRKMMTADQCARIALRAAQNRRREVLFGPGAMTAMLKLLAPGLLDWISVNIVLKAAAKRAQGGRKATDEPGTG